MHTTRPTHSGTNSSFDKKPPSRSKPPAEAIDYDSLERKVFVGGISHDTSRKDLHSYFSQYGQIHSIDIPIYKKKRKIKGFAFVRFTEAESARRATERTDQELNGKKISVRVSLDPETAAQKTKEMQKLKIFV